MRLEDGVAYPEGPLTQAEAARLLRQGEAALGQGCRVFDLAGVGQLDSAALSLLLSWRRRARELGRDVAFRNVPDSLNSLAGLYGVAELLKP